MAWHNESRRHSLARRGVKTAVDGKPISKVPHFNREQRIPLLIERMNRSALNNNNIPDNRIRFTAKLMNERLSDEQLKSELFENLSENKESGNIFSKQKSDPTQPIVFIDIDYAVKHRGNVINTMGKSVKKIKETVAEGTKLSDVPLYNLRLELIEEGNHRVEALKELGYKSVPVRITGAW